MNELEADYLIVGAGAMGMAFADVLVTETDATVIMVDKHHHPGGHWNDAYPFVRLHQPSAFYGVNSRALGENRIDTDGWNKGLYELATNSEVCAYFGQVMQHQFLPSGRVRYFPLCEHRGKGRFVSLLSGEEHQADVRKVVDATYMDVTVPAVPPPSFEVADDAHCVPLNDLPRTAGHFERHVVVGAGKTGMDACLFLLAHRTPPESISWIMPRDSWLLDRANIQPGEFLDPALEVFQAQMQAIAEATDMDDLFDRVQATGALLRLDPNVRPTMYRCATVTQGELQALRRIDDVVRLGHMQRIERDAIVMEHGTIPTSAATLHVHCAADGLAQRPAVLVFDGDHITLQAVRTCQQVFSAAFIAHIEATVNDDERRNALCTPVPHPDTDVDFLRTTLVNTTNLIQWMQDTALAAWLRRSRLDAFTPPPGEDLPDIDPTPMFQAIPNLQRLLAVIDGA